MVAYEALAGGTADTYIPFVAKSYRGMQSFSVVQNVGPATTTLTLTYEGYAPAAYSVTLAPGGTYHAYAEAEPFLPDDYHGALHLVSNNGQPLAAIGYTTYEGGSGQDTLAAHSLPQLTGTTLHYALAGKTTSAGGGGTGNTTLAVVNTGGLTATVSATFYDEFGNAYAPDPLSDSPNPFPLGPGASQVIALAAIPDLPDGRYAAVLSADQPLAGIALFNGEGPSCRPVAGVGFSWTPLTPTAGLAITFTASATGTAPISFTWNLGDGTLASGITVTHVYTAPGTYTAWLTATNCAAATAVVSDIVDVAAPCQPVTATALAWTPLTPTAGLAVTFTAAASGTAPIQYAWDLGDGTTATGATITHTYTTADTFTVALTATNGCGTDVVHKALTVRWVYIYLPLVVKGYMAP
jgi:chitodextrinase